MLNREEPFLTRWRLLLLYLGFVVLATLGTAWHTAHSAAPTSGTGSRSVAVVATTSGRAAALLVPALIAVPYLTSGRASGRRRLHYWAGYSVVGLSVMHTLATMYTPAIRHANRTGLRLATAALLLLLAQSFLGIRLRARGTPAGVALDRSSHRRGHTGELRRSIALSLRERVGGRGPSKQDEGPSLRQTHYWLMYATTAALVLHVALNF